jgi:hypothetical protein
MKHSTKQSQRNHHTRQQHETTKARIPGTTPDPTLTALVQALIQEKKLAEAQQVSLMRSMGQSCSNQQVQRWLGGPGINWETEAEDEFKPTGSLESFSALALPKPIKLKQTDVQVNSLGDYPLPSPPDTVMAWRETQPAGLVQREESGPSASLGTGGSLESGWKLELEGSYENLLLKNILKANKFKLDLNLSPKLNFAAEKLNTSKGEVSLENGWMLLQAKWLPFWQRQITAEISAFAKHTFVPHLKAEYGAKGELTQNLIEKKIKDTTLSLDLKFEASGGWTSHQEETKKPGSMWAVDAGVNFKVSF